MGDINEPVVYVKHKVLDYDGNEVKNGNTDPFINSLTHDSIIVQIPLLHGKINNRLDKVLSVFDQTQRPKDSQQVICIDENKYADDPEMKLILHRLTLATVNANVRQEMNDEDEFFSAIEERDTQVMQLNKIISENEIKLSEQSVQLSEQSAQLSEQSAQLSEQSAQLSEQSAQLSEQSAQLSEQSAHLSEQSAQLSEQSAQLSEQSAQLSEKDNQIARVSSFASQF